MPSLESDLAVAQLSDELPHFHGDQIAVVKIRDWLDWVTQKNKSLFVALPMIQRGSVWKPHKLAELWDSLLRGMPVGSLTVSQAEQSSSTTYRVMSAREARTGLIRKGSLFLLDGQQRTLAMCVGWDGNMDRRIWVDFGAQGLDGQPFRLRVTTQFQPFGYKSWDPSSKLSRSDRWKARDLFDLQADHKERFLNVPDHSLDLDLTLPFGAKHPLPLHMLVQTWRDGDQNLSHWIEQISHKLTLFDSSEKSEIEGRVAAFGSALQRLFEMRLALNSVAPELLDPQQEDQNGDATPPLVVLFERIANSGAPLSNADYVFSLIKHQFPEAHNFVSTLQHRRNAASLLTPNDLVMSAVRIAAGAHTQGGGKPFPDHLSMGPREFGKILKMPLDGGGSFLENALLPIINTVGAFALHKAFDVLQMLLEYRWSEASQDDIGLPRLMFPLLHRQLVQVLLFWIHRTQRIAKSQSLCENDFEASRDEILRFVLFWLLCIHDKDRASSTCFALIRDNDYRIFPGKHLYETLCEKEIASRLLPPQAVRCASISTLDNFLPIRSWQGRFADRETDLPALRRAVSFYQRWFHRKDLLLWLQRRMLVESFGEIDPLAGREDETPFDYDHICPQADWGSDYRSYDRPMKAHCEDRNAGIIGNSIGNYRVWDSSSNRHHQDSPAAEKLQLHDLESSEAIKLMSQSAIMMEEALGWIESSATPQNQGDWDSVRAAAFQAVVERRAFSLFERYFAEPCFGLWVQREFAN